MNKRLGLPQSEYGRLWRKENILLLPGFDNRAVKLIANRYTDCAIPAPRINDDTQIINLAQDWFAVEKECRYKDGYQVPAVIKN